MKNRAICAVAAAVLFAPAGQWAQEAHASDEAAAKPVEHFYKLALTVEELNESGKIANSRSYFETVSTQYQRPQQIRTGARIPVLQGGDQWNYMDVGVNFDVFEPKEIGDKLWFNLNADVSSLANAAAGTSGPISHPVVRQNKWSSNVVVPIGKPTVVFSSDDLDDKSKLQVEVTATRLE